MASAPIIDEKLSESRSSREIAQSGGNLGALLAAAGNGIRITGLVLVVEPVKNFKGNSKSGSAYSFDVREMQLWTGNKAVSCKHQGDPGCTFPDVAIGSTVTFKIRGVRMNGTVPTFELDETP